VLFAIWFLALLIPSQTLVGQKQSAYLGFDRNHYPGDNNLRPLRQTFSFAGYWLNNPPGEQINSWRGKRPMVEDAGFGFLVLFNGRLYAELRSVQSAAQVGKADGQIAISAARHEGFPEHTIIFLDQEQGGRMLPEQKAYIYAWVDAVTASGYKAGVYCSGISAAKQGGEDIITANDIRGNAAGREISFFVTNDACPPSPGCAFVPPAVQDTGLPYVDVWQFAQSPKRKDVAAGCHNYASDGECYAPGASSSSRLHIDIDSASSPDPSRGRTR
jgi:hypothetical protein